MQAAEQHCEQQSDQRQAKRRVIGRPWPKGVSGNPAGRKPYALQLNSLSDAELEARRAEAWRIVRARKATTTHKVAALKLLQRIAEISPRPAAKAADVLSRIASEHRPAVDQAEKINAAEQADKR